MQIKQTKKLLEISIFNFYFCLIEVAEVNNPTKTGTRTLREKNLCLSNAYELFNVQKTVSSINICLTSSGLQLH